MGSGSSRAGRAPRRRRSPDPAAPEGGTAAPARADPGPGPAAPPDGRQDTLRLLDQLLAELEPGPGPPAPAGAGRGGEVSSEQPAEDHPESSHAPEAPGSSLKRPEGQSAIAYDYSEEELMASIEREYCR